MAMFVHLTPAKNVKAILRSGITRLRKGQTARAASVRDARHPRLLRLASMAARIAVCGGQRTIGAIYFRILDTEPVWVGITLPPHRLLTAAEAAAQPCRVRKVVKGMKSLSRSRSHAGRATVCATCPRS